MRRVTRGGGVIAGYVWDFAAELSTNWPLRAGLRQIGADVPQTAGTAQSSPPALRSLFERAGLEEVDTMPIDVTISFADFDEFWRAQTPHFNPLTKTITALHESARRKLIETVRARLTDRFNGQVSYSARANAIKGRVRS